MKSLVSLRSIAEHCYKATEKETTELENQIKNIRLKETKLSFKDEKRIELRTSRRIKKESLEYFRGLKSSCKIMLEAIDNEINLKELDAEMIVSSNA